MKTLAKKFATFGASMCAYGVQQVSNVAFQDDLRIPIAAFDDVSTSALAHCKGSVREAYALADKLQSEAIETTFWMFSGRSFGGLLGKRGLGGDVQSARATIPGFARVQEAVITIASAGRHESPGRRTRSR